MSDELSTAEKIVEEVLIDLMTERVMSERAMSASIQASLMRGLQASLSTASWSLDHPDHQQKRELNTEMT
jgi:hypothetical protein